MNRYTISIISVFLCAFAYSMQNYDWSSYASDLGAKKYAPMNQINANNVKNLAPVWQWDSTDNDIVKEKNLNTAYYQTTPILANKRLYVSTPLNQVAALDPETGATIWMFDPKVYLNGYPANAGFAHRGVSYWTDGKLKRLIYGTNDGRLISLDPDSGSPINNFGAQGTVDLTQGLGKEVSRSDYGVTSPPAICKNTVIIGSSIVDMPFSIQPAPGDIRGYDVLTGQLKWTFHTVPKKGEFGNKTWQNDSWINAGNTNVWAPMSVDNELNAVYLPVSTPNNDFYGGNRPGDNLFGESLVSLNCETGKLNWHFQFVHHGLWDYDLPAAPVLMDLKINGRNVKAVAQVTKQAFVFVFDRKSGNPIWPIEEKKVELSTVDGEKSSPTQPFPTKPKPFDRQGISEDDLIDFTADLKNEAKNILGQYYHGPLYTPPQLNKPTLILPGPYGGASWAGAAYNPETEILYVPSITNPFATTIEASAVPGMRYSSVLSKSGFVKGPRGLPLTKPPYGRITAIDMKTGEHLWMSPVGRGPKDHEALKDLNISGDLGWPRRTHVLVTPSILFANQSGLSEVIGVNIGKGTPNSYKIKITDEEPYLRAFDPSTGEQLAKILLPGNSFAAPMTYEFNGKQYVVLAVGGANLKASIVALALKEN